MKETPNDDKEKNDTVQIVKPQIFNLSSKTCTNIQSNTFCAG